MKASDLMTADPLTVTSDESIQHASELMLNAGVGSLPVIDSADSRHLVGIITDRDIVMRCVAQGHDTSCHVELHMTASPLETVLVGDDEREVIDKMERARVRRIPVLNDDKAIVGIIAQADLARKLGPSEPKMIDGMLERISAPDAS